MEINCQLDATDVYYCKSYCLLKMFQALLCPSSGVQKYYTDGCCLWYLELWFSNCRYGVELRVVSKAPNTTSSNHLYNTLELLMMGIIVPETCWTSNKICNKKHLLHLVGNLFPHINDDARSKSLQKYALYYFMFLLTMWNVSVLFTHGQVSVKCDVKITRALRSNCWNPNTKL